MTVPYYDVHVVWDAPPTRMLPVPPVVSVRFECLTAKDREDARKNVLGLLWTTMGRWKVVEIKQL